ncbi:thiopurine S-methyltransferase [Marinobacter sp. X15-166B]|uniref:thiopurine S-methyltransferase n=1 Tax=Marinobacter sp. X15-166B TaxID=1897620 RepID=UPI00085CD68B|nr:thiopurine S-methyltransferase [Marinobacter sp. X15-166B]OEY65505.1 thiopurine S-methyltransferase [Marinobacter sp. X15-166B]
MEHEFWHKRWSNNQIGFHEGSVNQYLYDHWPELSRQANETVLVPLCGKAHDLWWLNDRGHPVIGVELSEIACKDFFTEAEEKATVTPGEPFTRFVHGDLQLWCGDFFQLVPDDLTHVKLVYDRAALIALPAEMRRTYVDHLTAVIPDDARMLLVTLDYNSDEMQGPPFNVTDEEVFALYGDNYAVTRILRQDLPPDNPFAKRKGLLHGATESVFRIDRK